MSDRQTDQPTNEQTDIRGQRDGKLPKKKYETSLLDWSVVFPAGKSFWSTPTHSQGTVTIYIMVINSYIRVKGNLL